MPPVLIRHDPRARARARRGQTARHDDVAVPVRQRRTLRSTIGRGSRRPSTTTGAVDSEACSWATKRCGRARDALAPARALRRARADRRTQRRRCRAASIGLITRRVEVLEHVGAVRPHRRTTRSARRADGAPRPSSSRASAGRNGDQPGVLEDAAAERIDDRHARAAAPPARGRACRAASRRAARADRSSTSSTRRRMTSTGSQAVERACSHTRSSRTVRSSPCTSV